VPALHFRTAAAAPAPPAAPSLRNLLLAPHRYAFAAGTALLLLVSLGWALWLAAPLVGVSARSALPPTMAHGFIFGAAFMPLFITGFIHTAGPRWLEVPPMTAQQLRWPVRLHVAGIALLMVGTLVEATVAAFGALLLAMALTATGASLAALLRASRARDQLHMRWVLAFWVVGIAAALLLASGLAIHHAAAAGVASWLLIFGCVAPITVTVAHRILPAFTSNAIIGSAAWRPNGVLALLLTGVIALGALQVAGRTGLLEAHTLAWLTLAMQTPVAVAAGLIAVRWGLLQSLGKPSLRLLAMLHLAFAWIPLALALACVDAALMLTAADVPRIGAMPLHALTMGFLGTMLFAMATRVISGHGGVAMTVDARIWSLFWLLQLAILLRLAAAVPSPAAPALAAGSAALWTVAWGAWALRYVPILLRPRADGRPG